MEKIAGKAESVVLKSTRAAMTGRWSGYNCVLQVAGRTGGYVMYSLLNRRQRFDRGKENTF